MMSDHSDNLVIGQSERRNDTQDGQSEDRVRDHGDHGIEDTQPQ